MPTVPFVRPRVRQAAIADTSATVRATAADFGSQKYAAVGELGQTGSQIAGMEFQRQNRIAAEEARAKKEAEHKANQDDQRLAMDADNQFRVESGLAGNEYAATKGASVTPEVREKYLEAVKNAATKFEATLPTENAKRMFRQNADRHMAALQVDADKHERIQGEVAAQGSREASHTLSLNIASGKWGTEEGRQAWKSALAIAETVPGLTPEQVEQQKIKDTSALAVDVVLRGIRNDDVSGAEQAFKEMNDSGLVNADTVDRLTAALGKAKEYGEDKAYVADRTAMVNSDNKPYTVQGITQNESALLDMFAEDVENGTITAERGKRLGQMVQENAIDQKRKQSAINSTQLNTWGPQIKSAGNLEAAKAVIKDAGLKPETAWMVPMLEELAQKEHGNEAANRARQEALELKNPEMQAKNYTAMMDVVVNRNKQNPPAPLGADELLAWGAKLHVSPANMARLVEANAGRGAVKGLTREAIASHLGDEAKKKFDKNPEDLDALMSYISDSWDPEEAVNYKTLGPAVARANWAMIVGKNATSVTLPNGRVVPATAASVRAAGADIERAARPVLSEAQLAEQKAFMLQKYKETGDEKWNPDPTKDNVIPEYIQPRFFKRGFGGEYDDVVVPEHIETVSAEENPEDRERSNFMAMYLLRDPGETLDDRNARKAAQSHANLEGMAGQTLIAAKAERDAALFLEKADYAPGVKGYDAARRFMEDDLEKGQVPDWLEKYSKDVFGESLERKKAGGKAAFSSDEPWRNRVRKVFLSISGGR